MTKSKYLQYRGEGSNIVNTWPKEAVKHFERLYARLGICDTCCTMMSPNKKFYCTRKRHIRGPHVAHAMNRENKSHDVVAVWD